MSGDACPAAAPATSAVATRVVAAPPTAAPLVEGMAAQPAADVAIPPPILTSHCFVIRDQGLAERVMEFASTSRDCRLRGGRDYTEALLGILP